MKSHDMLSTAAVLDLLGLQTKPTLRHRMLTYAAFAVSGILIGAAAGMLLAPKSGRALRADLRGGARELGHQVTAGAARAKDAITPASRARTGNANDSSMGAG